MKAIKKTLVVDDNRLPRMITRRIFEEKFPGVEVAEAASADEALELARSQGDFDLVLLDINMPGMTGLELAPILVEEQLIPQICFVSANIQQHIQDTADELGACFITKPVSEEKIVKLINRIEGK